MCTQYLFALELYLEVAKNVPMRNYLCQARVKKGHRFDKCNDQRGKQALSKVIVILFASQ